MQQRVFFELQQRVGAQGKYQKLSFIIWALILFTAGASSFFNAFLFYQNDYEGCPAGITDCNSYVCSLPADQRDFYINHDFSSLASQFGDYRCQKSGEIYNIQSFIYIGGIVGVIIGAVTNQIISKKRLIILTLLANLLGLVLAIFSPYLILAGIGLLINFAAKSIQMEVIICYITETVQQKLSGKLIMIAYMGFASGGSLNGLFFLLIKSWKLVLLIYVIIPICIGLISLIFYIQEAPLELVTKRSPERSYKAFLRIASINKIQNHGITLEQITNIKKKYIQNQQKKHDYAISILDLFRYKSLRFMSILSIILHFLISFQFNSPQLALQDYSLNVYLNGIIIGSSEVVSCFLCSFIVSNFRRKRVIYVTEIMALTLSIPLIIFASCQNSQDKCSIQVQIIQSVGLFLFRFLITFAYNFFYMIQYVVFPTQIRALGLQTTAIASYTAIVLFPQVLAFCQQIGISIIITFSITCGLVIIFTYGLPQTLQVVSPDMIQELKFSQYQSFNEDKQT